MASDDLSVQCRRSGPAGREWQFAAARLTNPSTGHWILCVSSDRHDVHVTAVHPPPAAYALDRDGVLGLVFPSTTSRAIVCIAGSERLDSEWTFWLDDGNDVTSAGPADSPWPALRC